MIKKHWVYDRFVEPIQIHTSLPLISVDYNLSTMFWNFRVSQYQWNRIAEEIPNSVIGRPLYALPGQGGNYYSAARFFTEGQHRCLPWGESCTDEEFYEFMVELETQSRYDACQAILKEARNVG